MQARWGIKRFSFFLALVPLFALLAMTGGCGGDDKSGAGSELSTEDRMMILEAQISSFQDYIVLQAQKEAEAAVAAGNRGGRGGRPGDY